jgi:hypothetical protein
MHTAAARPDKYRELKAVHEQQNRQNRSATIAEGSGSIGHK